MRGNRPVDFPNDGLRQALHRLGEAGVRAQRFLTSSAEQLNEPRTQSGELAAYALREALMSLVDLGGARQAGVGDAAERVVSAWRLSRSGGEGVERLGDAVARLELALIGPGRNERRLESAITGLARRRPSRANADLLDQFIGLLERANTALHTSLELSVAAELHHRTLEVIEGLFGPMTERLAGLDELIAIGDPGPDEVERLRSRVGDDRHLAYFFERVEGSGWVRALSEEAILHPPAEGAWPAGPYVTRVAANDPELVRAWLAARSGEHLTSQQASGLLRVARVIRLGVAPVVLDLARPHFDSLDLLFQIELYLRELPEEELGDRAVRWLVRDSLPRLLSGGRGGGDVYLAERLVDLALRAIPVGNARSWLMVLAYRLRELAERESALRLRLLGPLPELRLHASSPPLALMTAAVRAATNVAADVGLSLAERLVALEVAPEPLRARLVAQHLQDQLEAVIEQAAEFVVRRVAENVAPSPEELALLRAVREQAPPGLDAALESALGAAPPSDRLSNLAAEEPLPDDLRRAHRWLVAMPSSIQRPWQQADEQMTERVGHAPADGVLIRVAAARFGGHRSPFSVDELAALKPLQAAEQIAAWRPVEGDSFLGPSPRGAADVLEQLIDQNRKAWLSIDPVEAVRALRHPIYIAAYFIALGKTSEWLPENTSRLVTAVALAQSQPWPVADLGHADDTGEHTWLSASHAGVRLIGKLIEREVLDDASRDQAWVVISAAARARDDRSPIVDEQAVRPLDHAINRPSMVALEVAFALGGHRPGTTDQRLLDLLEESLRLDSPDGLHARAIISSRLAWLRQAAPVWFSDHESLILGEEAPNGLGEATFGLYLEWGSPSQSLLEEQRPRILRALEGPAAEHARVHVLHAMLWGVSGYSAAEVCDALTAVGPEQLSEAARWLGWALADSEVDLEPALSLWREALSRELPAEAYQGWGWFAGNQRAGEQAWLELTLQTVQRTGGDLDEPARVAERASRSPADERALAIVGTLLDGNAPLWDIERIGLVGLELLRTGAGEPGMRQQLRERLLERGFHDAADLP